MALGTSGEMRTITMSFATCSPRRRPVSKCSLTMSARLKSVTIVGWGCGALIRTLGRANVEQ